LKVEEEHWEQEEKVNARVQRILCGADIQMLA
jgi:hypothetical protein